MAFLAFERLFLELFRVSSILPSLCFWFGLSTWLYVRINFWVLNYRTGLRSAESVSKRSWYQSQYPSRCLQLPTPCCSSEGHRWILKFSGFSTPDLTHLDKGKVVPSWSEFLRIARTTVGCTVRDVLFFQCFFYRKN